MYENIKVANHGSPVVLVVALPFPPLDTWICESEYVKNNVIYWTQTESVYKSSWEPCPVPEDVITRLTSPKFNSQFFQAIFFMMMENMVTVIFLSMGQLSYFIFCEGSFLIIGISLWNTVMVKKAFCRSIDGIYCFGRNITFRKGILNHNKYLLHLEQNDAFTIKKTI
jgi:hypothetical protein